MVRTKSPGYKTSWNWRASVSAFSRCLIISESFRIRGGREDPMSVSMNCFKLFDMKIIPQKICIEVLHVFASCLILFTSFYIMYVKFYMYRNLTPPSLYKFFLCNIWNLNLNATDIFQIFQVFSSSMQNFQCKFSNITCNQNSVMIIYSFHRFFISYTTGVSHYVKMGHLKNLTNFWSKNKNFTQKTWIKILEAQN